MALLYSISWFDYGIHRKTVDYSDEALIQIMKQESKHIHNFSMIHMSFTIVRDRYGSISVNMAEDVSKLGNHQVLNIYEWSLEEDDFSNHVKEAQRLKRLIKKQFPNICVTSNFR